MRCDWSGCTSRCDWNGLLWRDPFRDRSLFPLDTATGGTRIRGEKSEGDGYTVRDGRRDAHVTHIPTGFGTQNVSVVRPRPYVTVRETQRFGWVLDPYQRTVGVGVPAEMGGRCPTTETPERENFCCRLVGSTTTGSRSRVYSLPTPTWSPETPLPRRCGWNGGGYGYGVNNSNSRTSHFVRLENSSRSFGTCGSPGLRNSEFRSRWSTRGRHYSGRGSL